MIISICCGKQKPTLSYLRRQVSRDKKMDSRLRGNDKMSFPQQELIRQKIFHKGFTIIEMLIVSAGMMIVLLGVGAALVHCQNNWGITYERVNGDAVSDAYTAKRAFEVVARQSSVDLRPPAVSGDGELMELYIYENISSNTIDSYVRFYVENGELIAMYGKLSDTGYNEVVTSEIGSLQTSSSSEDAFISASASLAGNEIAPDSNSRTLNAEEIVASMEDAAFEKLLIKSIADIPVESLSASLISVDSKITTLSPITTPSSVTTSSSVTVSKLVDSPILNKGPRKLVLARNVKQVNFSVHGSTVRMILTVEKNGVRKKIMASAVRHSG